MISLGNDNAPVSGESTTQNVRGVAPGSDAFEPDLTLEDITNGRLARIIEETRMARRLQIAGKIGRRKLEAECIDSQMRAQMNRDGVVRYVIPGVGKATLMEA